MKRIMYAVFVVLALLVGLTAEMYAAGTPAWTVITNTATLNYKDLGGTSFPAVVATVSITVAQETEAGRSVETLSAQAAIVASGLDEAEVDRLSAFGHGRIPGVVTALEIEQHLGRSPRPPLLRPGDGKPVARAALQQAKRAIVAGPGNPPVVVDETADLDRVLTPVVVHAGPFAQDADRACLGTRQRNPVRFENRLG